MAELCWDALLNNRLLGFERTIFGNITSGVPDRDSVINVEAVEDISPISSGVLFPTSCG